MKKCLRLHFQFQEKKSLCLISMFHSRQRYFRGLWQSVGVDSPTLTCLGDLPQRRVCNKISCQAFHPIIFFLCARSRWYIEAPAAATIVRSLAQTLPRPTWCNKTSDVWRKAGLFARKDPRVKELTSGDFDRLKIYRFGGVKILSWHRISEA